MKKWFVLLVAIFVITSLVGCDALQRKLTRKNKVVKAPHFYQLKKYTRKPSPELYKQHFSYWRSWQSELIQFLGDNHKKDKQAIDEAVGQLKDMQSILIPSKAENMQLHVEKMEGVKETISRRDLSFANKDYVRRILEREDRAIKREFCYEKVKNSLRKSSGEEEVPQLSMAAGREVPVEQKK